MFRKCDVNLVAIVSYDSDGTALHFSTICESSHKSPLRPYSLVVRMEFFIIAVGYDFVHTQSLVPFQQCCAMGKYNIHTGLDCRGGGHEL